MKLARKVGWRFLWTAAAVSPFLFAINWLADETIAWPILSFECKMIAWILGACILFCLLRAAWELTCGYSPKAWQYYARTSEEATRKQIRMACREQDSEPPSWLREDQP
jgi:hypothetical protein